MSGPSKIAPVVIGLILLVCPSALALDPSRDVSQYAHTSWKVRDGFVQGMIQSIAQTPDGYLWIGTNVGLFRFDGVKADQWQPPTGQSLPANGVWELLGGRDGTLWIGTEKGLASWKNGQVTRYPEIDGHIVLSLLEDREGSVWVGAASVPTGKLCAIRNGSVKCDGTDGRFGYAPFGLYEDAKQNLWVGVSKGLWKWKPGTPELFPMPDDINGIQGFDEDLDGTLLIATVRGVKRFSNGKMEASTPDRTWQGYSPDKLLRDRDGALWIGTSEGLGHVHDGRTDWFEMANGLSDDAVAQMLEDREGNVWVATLNGLDRFRDLAVATLREAQGLSNVPATSLTADLDGSVWINTANGLRKWNRGRVTAYRERASDASPVAPIAQEIVGTGLPDRGLHALFRDRQGRIVIATADGVGYLENRRFTPIHGVPGGVVRFITADSQGTLLISNQQLGLVEVGRGGEVRRTPWEALGRKDFATATAPDLVRGGLWLGFFSGGLAYVVDHQVRESYSPADGLADGRINHIQLGTDGTLWIATASGLSRVKGDRITTLTKKSGLPCDGAQWTIEDDNHGIWIGTPCGLVEIRRSDLDQLANRVQKRGEDLTIPLKVLDGSEGVRIVMVGYSPIATKSLDGKLWFIAPDGVGVVDPTHIPSNPLAPPVHIERMTADRKSYAVGPTVGPMALPPLIRDLQIDYTALSLVAPEKVMFRYRLEGRDSEWQDVGSRRQAFYTDLSPGNYRFRVLASNNSGVWNETGAFVDFSVAPAYYQTAWFRVSVFAAFGLFLVALYQLRLRGLARQSNIRMEERVNERTRIARDLHDTLLQSFQAVLLKTHAVTYQLQDRPEAVASLEGIIEQARQAITEGRDAVQILRTRAFTGHDLGEAIGTIVHELSSEPRDEKTPEVRVQVEGMPRELAPLVRDEVYRIACEALRNAFRHAKARKIEVDLHYDLHQLRLRIGDDGQGMSADILKRGAGNGHFGLRGMHERAELLGGALAVWSEVGAGTELELTVPSSKAYAKKTTTTAARG